MKGSYNINLQPMAQIKESKFKRNAKATFASIIIGIETFAAGTTGVYTTTAIPNIISQRNAPFQLNLSEQSWFTSIVVLASIPGSFLSGILMDATGRKLALLILAIPTAIGWVIIICAQNVAMALIGRAITGITAGALIPISFAYTSELAPPEIRGLLVSFMELTVNGGILFSYVVGTYVPWNWLAVASAAINCVATCLLLLVPETPCWLLLKGHTEEAKKSLNWLHFSEVESEKEMADILESLRNVSKPTPFISYLKRPLLKFTLISQLLFIIIELSGLNCIRLYAVSIFQMSGSDLNPNTQTIVIGATSLLGSILSATFADVFARKTLFMTSMMFVAIGTATIGTYVKVKDYFIFFKEELFWLPLAGLIIATLGWALGGIGLTSILTSEMFSTQARGRAIGIAYFTNFLSCFVVLNLFMLASKTLGEATVFWFFAGVCLFGSVISFFIIPKTKGLSMEEIQNRINNEVSH